MSRLGVFTCDNCQKIMSGVCPSCSAWYCSNCYNWHCDPAVFPSSRLCRSCVPTVRVVPSLLHRSSVSDRTELIRLSVLSSPVFFLACLLLFFFSSCSQSDNLSLVGAPTVTVAFIEDVLAANHSPITGYGETFYDFGLQYNVDPAFALGFFHHESDFGKSGVAIASYSIGNLRCLPDYPCIDGFAYFPNWTIGIKEWYRLISGPVYVGAGLTTLGPIVHKYAPSSDGNAESVYVEAVGQDVTRWRSGQV